MTEARGQLLRLLSSAQAANSHGAARLHFELAELAARQDDDQGALHYLRSAYQAAPDAPSIHAVLEDRLLDGGDLSGLCEVLEARARNSEGADQRVLLWRAALAAERAQEPERALGLWSSLVGEPAAGSAALRCGSYTGWPPRAAAIAASSGSGAAARLRDLCGRARGACGARATRPRSRNTKTRPRAPRSSSRWKSRRATCGRLTRPGSSPRCVAIGRCSRAHTRSSPCWRNRSSDPDLAAAHRAAQGRALPARWRQRASHQHCAKRSTLVSGEHVRGEPAGTLLSHARRDGRGDRLLRDAARAFVGSQLAAAGAASGRRARRSLGQAGSRAEQLRRSRRARSQLLRRTVGALAFCRALTRPAAATCPRSARSRSARPRISVPATRTSSWVSC